MWDFAGSMGPDELAGDDRATFLPANAVLFVIDAQDDLAPVISTYKTVEARTQHM